MFHYRRDVGHETLTALQFSVGGFPASLLDVVLREPLEHLVKPEALKDADVAFAPPGVVRDRRVDVFEQCFDRLLGAMQFRRLHPVDIVLFSEHCTESVG